MRHAVCLMAGVLLIAGAAQAVVMIETVPVGDAGNAADTTGYGAVSYNYSIGKYGVTVDQYVEFMNFKEIDKSTPLLMFVSDLAANHIVLDQGVNPFLFRSIDGYGSNSVVGVTFWNACRFVNWLNNGQGSGDMEDGVYTLSDSIIDPVGFNRKGALGQAKWVIPNIDEWYKAAYYIGSGYLSSAGASAYGTVDQYGVNFEWTDSFGSANSLSGRILGGGPVGISVPVDFKGTSLGDPSKGSAPVFPLGFPAPVENMGFGFRVAEVPEPATMLLLGLGGIVIKKRKC